MISATVSPAKTNIKNFAALIEQLKSLIVPELTIREIIELIVSLGERLNLNVGLESLTSQQTHFINLLGNMKSFSFIPDESKKNIIFGITGYGKLWTAALDNYESDGHDHVLGYFIIEKDMWGNIVNLADQKIKSMITDMDKYYAEISEEEVLKMVSVVKKMVDYVDPVLIYIEDDTYTLFGKFNNLIAERESGKEHLFDRLSKLEVTEWNTNDKMFVLCMFMLHSAGFRGEEFNGIQLNIVALNEYFDERYNFYVEKLQINENSNFYSENLYGKSTILAQLKKTLQKEFTFYRLVNGLNFNKKEEVFLESKLSIDREVLSPTVFEKFSQLFNMNCCQEEGIYRLFYTGLVKWFTRVEQLDQKSSIDIVNPIEEMIHTIVECAIVESQSDIGMSRSVRNFSKFLELDKKKKIEEICNLPITEYFCCVTPSKGMKGLLNENRKVFLSILSAIAQRMNYNSWHYIPGHFEMPDSRHFYYPPRMPDIAEWSNVHHSGHVLAKVLHSIRYPGELCFPNKIYYGLFDLRLMRQSGEPYTLDDLKVAGKYQYYLKRFYQALVDSLEATNATFEIEAFGSEWYRSF